MSAAAIVSEGVRDPTHATATIHACAVIIGDGAVLIRGPSGSGKSASALALVELAQTRGLFARLVADDRVRLRCTGERLIVAPHPAIAGQIERRFVGISREPHEPQAVVRLVVDLVPPGILSDVTRLPSEAALWTVVQTVRLPRLALPAVWPGAGEAVLHRLRQTKND